MDVRRRRRQSVETERSFYGSTTAVWFAYVLVYAYTRAAFRRTRAVTWMEPSAPASARHGAVLHWVKVPMALLMAGV